MSSPHSVPAEAAEGEPADAVAPDQAAEPAGGGGATAGPTARRPWTPWGEMRADLRPAALTLAVLVVAGLVAGLVWWWLAPRADFRIASGGPTPIGNPSDELLAADDVVFALVLAGLGLVAGLVLWFRRSSRGVAALVALAVGMTAAGALAWLTGRLLAPDPSRAALTHVGAVVRTGLDLASWPALAVGPFFALLVYLLASVLDGTDDLGRRSRRPVADPPAN